MSRWSWTGLALAALWGCKTGGAIEPEVQPAVPVQLGKVELSRIRDTSDYIATLKSRRLIVIRPQVEGLITHIAVHSGDKVRHGQLLMQIDPARQFHTLSSQRASVTSKEAALAYAGQELDRVQRLFKGAASQQELDQSRTARDTARAELEVLGAQVRESEVQLKYFSVVAPEDGVVGDIPVREGDYVSPSAANVLTTVDENHELEIYVSVPVEKASALRLGMPVQLTDDVGHHLGDSQVTFISPEVAEETQSVLVKATISNGSGALRVAQFVRARVIWSEHQGPVLPATAVKRFSGQSFAFAAVEKNGKLIAEQRPVSLGPLDETQYPVEGGLAAGDTIVVSGLQKLHDGSILTSLPAPKG